MYRFSVRLELILLNRSFFQVTAKDSKIKVVSRIQNKECILNNINYGIQRMKLKCISSINESVYAERNYHSLKEAQDFVL